MYRYIIFLLKYIFYVFNAGSFNYSAKEKRRLWIIPPSQNYTKARCVARIQSKLKRKGKQVNSTKIWMDSKNSQNYQDLPQMWRSQYILVRELSQRENCAYKERCIFDNYVQNFHVLKADEAIYQIPIFQKSNKNYPYMYMLWYGLYSCVASVLSSIGIKHKSTVYVLNVHYLKDCQCICNISLYFYLCIEKYFKFHFSFKSTSQILFLN